MVSSNIAPFSHKTYWLKMNQVDVNLARQNHDDQRFKNSLGTPLSKTSDSQPGVRVPLEVRKQVTGGMPKFKISSQ
jgi:hypothetical protein